MVVQYQDKNVTPLDYNHVPPDKLLVHGLYQSIQSDGPYTGWPAMIVRLAGCNRGRKEDTGCWFCDASFSFAGSFTLSFQEIYDEVMRVTKDKPGLIVVTGGEPMMQDNLRGFLVHINNMKALMPSLRVLVESNGDRLVKDFDPLLADLIINPKMNGDSYRLPPADILTNAFAFKFNVSGEVDNSYYKIPVWANQLKCPVYVSPIVEYLRQPDARDGVIGSAWNNLLVDHFKTKRNYERAAQIALSRNFRVSIQQNIWLGVL